MNVSFSSSDPAADEVAALWAARLDGSDLSAADRASLNTWLAANPAHRTLLSSYCQFSADLEHPLSTLVSSGAVQLPTFSSPSRPSRWKLITGTALVAMAAALTVAIWVAQPRTSFNHIESPVAHRESITLSDGTQVDLNAHTTLQVSMSKSERRVRLTSGEAFFAVHKDASRPFIIETSAGSVRVTGTTFNVRTEDALALEVTVVEGSVQVRPGDNGTLASRPVLLGAGDRLLAGPHGVTVKQVTPSTLQDVLAWRKGGVVFDGVPLRDALNRFAYYHGRTMTVSDAAAGLSVGGRYSLDDPNGFLKGLEDAFPVQAVTDAKGTVRVRLRDEQ
ncbi:MAG: FecR domain-containing protein [Opitutus sp.]